MAMRWSSCSAALLLAACVTTSTTYYVRSPANPEYTMAQAEPVLANYVGVQCPARVQAQRPDTGSARLVVDVDSSGRATRAEVRTSSSDEILDRVFGTVAAQLVLPRDTAAAPPRQHLLAIDFRCSPESALVQLMTRPVAH